MSILENMVNVDDAQEPKVMDNNSEVKVRILDVKTGTSEKGDLSGMDYLSVRLEVVGEPLAKDFNKFLWVPSKELESIDRKKFERARYEMKTFMQAFEIDPARPGDPEDDWAGLEAWAVLGVQESEEYGKQNSVKKFVTPR